MKVTFDITQTITAKVNSGSSSHFKGNRFTKKSKNFSKLDN